LASRVGKVAGFSLHAGVAARANEREEVRAGTAREAALGYKLERLCRYIARPEVSTKRLSMTRNGQVRYELKTPYTNGTTHIIFEPLDIMYRMYGMPWAQGCAGTAISRLVALIPKPRVNLTRFHGVFAPNSKHRLQVTPAKRGKVKRPCPLDEDQTSAERRAWPRPASRPVPGLTFSMTWTQRLKRVFDIDIETCSECGGDVRIIASIRLHGCRR